MQNTNKGRASIANSIQKKNFSTHFSVSGEVANLELVFNHWELYSSSRTKLLAHSRITNSRDNGFVQVACAKVHNGHSACHQTTQGSTWMQIIYLLFL
jgi:hypothetical protein